ncbi:3-isopropylmalate dehydratase small subunit [Sedimentibacter acidaminivorans]|jgi:3-isopropylmalate dehydratase small subunit|uniref:3-isopropylmalate dehydratase small subunit n=1 Tax=Sedimentibacter acidaminivorans TaxID=913099 RepID=A0ABS4GDV5_9FIRM|nr:3-isopropylmalate dehydratase [Sedimentibacter acidaminivorans]MBP1925883.1 3-isopropylmalate dehydratase small subunit [Sedimentibacter acidaminivorans]
MGNIKGKAFLLNENVDTDQILPGYAMSYPVEELKKVALCGSIIPDFANLVKSGDIIIADDNFGCGSSREQAPVALKSAGVGAVIAKSFGRIFRKNAINIGLPVVVCEYIDKIKSESKEDDEFDVDLVNSTITNLRTQNKYVLNSLSETTLETLQAGGLINKVRNKLVERGAL